MAKSLVPINPKVLTWAMDQAGVDDFELALRCKTTPEVVRGWRTGELSPGKTEFKKLVARLRRPSATYFLPSPPSDDPAVAAFRHPPGAEADRALIDRELTFIRTAERIQKVGGWARGRTGQTLAPWPRLAGLKPDQAALKASQFLGWKISDQFGAKSSSQAAAALRQRIEDRGAFVLQLPLSQDGCRGFSLDHPAAPVIAVNSAYTVPARIFSMVHEVGHIVLHQPSFCARLPQANETEKWCERFAAIFLMPAGDFKSYVVGRFGDAPVADIDDVKTIANKFRVSLRAAAFRVEQLELGVEGLYEAVDAGADFKGSGGYTDDNTTPAIRLREWGEGYARLVASASEHGILSSADALEYLNVSGKQYREIVTRLELSEAGSEE